MLPGEPSGPIQVAPAGLLGFLQLKSPAGRNPTVLFDSVQPTIDLFNFWMQSRVIDDTVNTQNLVAGSGGFTAWSTPIIVPQGETWFITNYSILATLAAGDTVTQMRPIVRYNPLVGVTPFGRLGTDVATSNAASRIIVAAENFWLPPGAELGIFTTSTVSAGNIACLGYLHKTILKT